MPWRIKYKDKYYIEVKAKGNLKGCDACAFKNTIQNGDASCEAMRVMHIKECPCGETSMDCYFVEEGGI